MKRAIKRLELLYRMSLEKFRGRKVYFDKGCSVDRKSIFGGFNKLGPSVVFSGILGRFSYIGSRSEVHGRIGSFCSIGVDVLFITGTHPLHRFSTHPAFYSNKMQALFSFNHDNSIEENPAIASKNGRYSHVIEDDVWIGSRAIILPGIKIDHGAVVLANSVVTKNVEKFSIVGGVPAKHISYRFEGSKAEEVLESNWWKKSIDELKVFNDETF